MTDRITVARMLEPFIEEAEAVAGEVRWEDDVAARCGTPDGARKIKVARYLDKNVGHSDAQSFISLCTSLGSGRDDQRFRSAYENHIGYLTVLAAKIEDNDGYELIAPPKKLVFNDARLTYST